jgi:phytoene desaturase
VADRPSVVVVGGGVGGLTAAIRLGVAGHAVTLLERNDDVGGKLASEHEGGFAFDVGPSLLTLPHLFDEVFRLAGTSLREQVELVRLDPQFAYHWPDGSDLTVHDDPLRTVEAFDRFDRGAGAQWRAFDTRGRRIWDVAERTFLAGPMSSPLRLVGRLRSPRDLLDIDPLRTLAGAAGECFSDPRLVQWAGRYATYSGSSPYHAPATLACIPHVEARWGCWYPMGGLGALREALARTARDIGVEIRTGSEVRRVMADRRRVWGVRLAGGDRLRAPIVVADVDAEHLYRDLLPEPRALTRVRRAGRSTSGFVVCVGARGRTPGVRHHNVWFSAGARGEFAALEAGHLADDPTIYACVSSVTDPSQAPLGDENWFLLVNTPAGIEVDRDGYRRLVLDRLADAGVDLRSRAVTMSTMTPGDIASRYRSPGGAIYGTSSDGRRAAFLRPGNRGTRGGLYLVGGSSHPGGGLPLVTISARIVAGMVAADAGR